MPLRIVIGFSRPGSRGASRVVYVGESGAEADLARLAAPDASFLVLNNPVGIRKNGRPVDPNASAVETARPGVVLTDDQIAEMKLEFQRLADSADEAEERIAELLKTNGDLAAQFAEIQKEAAAKAKADEEAAGKGKKK